jgi:predicted DNA-binding transcriptional regulator AlpA
MEVLMNNTEFFELRAILERIEDSLSNKNTEKYLTINNVADFCSLSISSIRRYVQKGELKCSRKSGKLLFKVEWVDNWLEDK